MSDKKSADYAATGVDINAADNWIARLQNLQAAQAADANSNAGVPPPPGRIVSGIGDYASVYALNDDQYVATSTDGVGTKLLWTLDQLGSAEDLAQDLVAMNSNDLLCVGARPTLFLDYLAVGSKKLLQPGEVLERFMTGLNRACLRTGQLLVGGETAQMPDLYAETHFDLAGFNVGFLRPDEFLNVEGIYPGASVWAWPSSGPHSNGFTLLRRLFDAERDAAYIRQTFMSPTRLYVKEFLTLRQELAAHGGKVQGAFHLTGSGFWNFIRSQPGGRTIGFELTLTEADVPHWISEVQRRSGLSLKELGETFNMGWGFAIVLPRELGESTKDLLHSKGLRCIGSVVEEPHVTFLGATLRD